MSDDVPPALISPPVIREEIARWLPGDTGQCPECGSPGSEPLKTRPDYVECATGCGTWVRPAADPAVTWALDFWQQKYRDATLDGLAARPPAALVAAFLAWCDTTGEDRGQPWAAMVDTLRAVAAAPQE